MRQQVNLITEALRTCNSGATAPTPTVAGMLWYDNSATPGILYQRNNANDAWVPIAAADGSVTNAKLADVATATLKGRVTAGTGAPEDLTVGQVQTLLGIDPGGGGSRTLISTLTASASASLSFTAFDAAEYIGYEFIFSNVKPATDSVLLTFRTSANGGSSYDSGATDYSFVVFGGGATPSSFADASESYIIVARFPLGNATDETGFTGLATLIRPDLSTFTPFTASGVGADASGGTLLTSSTGFRKSNAVVNGARFLMSSGNIASGTIYVYGIKG